MDPSIDQEDVQAAVNADPHRERFKFQYDLFANSVRAIQTYDRHVFVFVDKATGKVVFRHRASPPADDTVLDGEGELVTVQ